MDAIAEAFLGYAVKRLRQLQQTIAQSVGELTDEQMFHRSGDYENSIANLLLHLEGNLRQWILHGIEGQPDIRRRDDEFALALSISPSEAHARFDAALDEAARVIAALNPAGLLKVIDPQPTGIVRHPAILEAVFKVVGHVEMHAGQIILLTKQLSAKDLDLTIPRPR